MRIYKLPDARFLSAEHNLIKQAQPSADEEALKFQKLITNYDASFELEGLNHHSIDHYLAYKMNPDRFQEIMQTQTPLNYIKPGTTFSEIETSEYLKTGLIATMNQNYELKNIFLGWPIDKPWIFPQHKILSQKQLDTIYMEVKNQLIQQIEEEKS